MFILHPVLGASQNNHQSVSRWNRNVCSWWPHFCAHVHGMFIPFVRFHVSDSKQAVKVCCSNIFQFSAGSASWHRLTSPWNTSHCFCCCHRAGHDITWPAAATNDNVVGWHVMATVAASDRGTWRQSGCAWWPAQSQCWHVRCTAQVADHLCPRWFVPVLVFVPSEYHFVSV